MLNPERLEYFERARHRRMAEHAGGGVIVDVGYVNRPNRFLRGEQVIGLDLYAESPPPGYDRVVRGDALSMPFEDRSLDAVVAGELVEHVPDPMRFFLEINRVLKPGGRWVFTVPNPYHPPEIFKNVFASRRDLFTNSHVVAPAYRLMVKLLDLAGFEVTACFGDYLRVPKLHYLIPMGRVPGLAYSNGYATVKTKDVDSEGVRARMAEIHAHEAEASRARRARALEVAGA